MSVVLLQNIMHVMYCAGRLAITIDIANSCLLTNHQSAVCLLQAALCKCGQDSCQMRGRPIGTSTQTSEVK